MTEIKINKYFNHFKQGDVMWWKETSLKYTRISFFHTKPQTHNITCSICTIHLKKKLT